ncbi:intraflagellar transport protein 20 homolog isoform X1 [Takifugu rubripes]|nr:intraflagellar transport protein 20 homolog isoform X1 [Takifugu rubripes]|eukprot:XP_011617457.1 PREDICTED: intraflagellar transport protein 20 homolog isoform X1 [Takifugu rubripes]
MTSYIIVLVASTSLANLAMWLTNVAGVSTGPVTMAKDPLAEAGLYFDEVSGLQILDPDVRQKSLELKEECKIFIDDFGQFQKITGEQIQMLDELAKDVEREKKKAIGAKFLLNSMRRQREAKTQQLQALIAEKKMELERLCTEYEALHKIEMEENDFINQFMQK